VCRRYAAYRRAEERWRVFGATRRHFKTTGVRSSGEGSNVEKLDAWYRELLQFGLVVLRRAIYAGNIGWSKLEVEMLHNIPSLIGEPNLERHGYYWFTERELYRERIAALGLDEPKSCMRTYYEPIWQEMEPVLMRMLEPE
jgi:hypothetical protein